MTSIEITLLFLLGSATGATVMYFRLKSSHVSKFTFDDLASKLADSISKTELANSFVHKSLYVEASNRISKLEQDIKTDYIPKTAYDALNTLYGEAQASLKVEQGRIETLTREIAEFESAKKHLEEKLSTFNVELDKIRLENEKNFRDVASSVLKETGSVLLTQGSEVVTPIKNELEAFKKSVDEAKTENIRDLTSLKTEIKTLENLNQQLSADAQSLTNALKSDVKVQGNLGEDRLRYLLEAEGLERYVDFTLQESFKDEDTNKDRRPDAVLNLPEKRCLVIDSKVSLEAYWAYFNATTPEEKKAQQQALVKSVKKHIDDLSSKNYQSLIGLKKTPDFVVMVMPFEAAFTMALNEDPTLFDRARKSNIIIATPMTLVALLKVVRLIWQTENRIHNVEEIFRQCGKLYDKFEGFLVEYLKIGESIDDAKSSFLTARDRLTKDTRRGETVIGRLENIKKLEAKTNKTLPASLLSDLNLLEDGEDGDNAPLLTQSLPATVGEVS